MNMDDASVRVRDTLKQREQRRISLERFGWREILDAQKIQWLSERFCGSFYNNDAFQLPRPFITWDVDHAENDVLGLKKFADDLHSKRITALKSVKHPGQWYVLENINHPWYCLELSRVPDCHQEWPVVLLPNADPCYFLADNFECGIIAETNRTISVFGQRLLAALINQTPLVLSQIRDRSEE